MNDLITMLQTATDKTPEQADALRIDNAIRLHKMMIQTELVGMAHDLKEMRDRALYKELGYDAFESYTENEHGIKSRQAYKYIRAYEQLGDDFLHSSAKLGITKLDMLASLDADEREAVLADHTVEELDVKSTSEYKELLAKYEKSVEQLSFLESATTSSEDLNEADIEEMKERFREELEDEIRSEYEERIDDLTGKVMTDDELREYRLNAEKEARDAAREEMRNLKAELKIAKDNAKAQADAAKKAQEAQKAAETKAAEAEKAASAARELEAKIKTAEAEKEAAEKKIRLSSDPELTRFKYVFETWQNATVALTEQLAKLEPDKQVKMKQAIKSVIGGIEL